MSLNGKQSLFMEHEAAACDLHGRMETNAQPVPPFVLRLEGVPATAANRARIGTRVAEINRQFRDRSIPFELRLL